MARTRLSKAQKAFREASDLVKDKSLNLRTAERLHKMEGRKVRKLLLSKAQEAELKAASDAQSIAHDRVVTARKEWLAAIDKMILAGESLTKKRKLH